MFQSVLSFTDAACCAALLSIPAIFKGKTSDVLKLQVEGEPVKEPASDACLYIQADCVPDDLLKCTQFNVILENNPLCEAGDFFEAFCVYIAAYYCFNIVYSAKMLKALIFIEKAILHIHDTSKKGKKMKDVERQVSKIIVKLNDDMDKLPKKGKKKGK